MMTVSEVSRLAGVSIRTLQYYDRIGLLSPACRTESGYRLYDDTALEQLQQILLFRELEFPLKEIKKIISKPDFDREKALEQQITLLTMKKERLEKLIDFARRINNTGGKTMDFSVFDTEKIDEYARRAKAQWGGTDAYREFEGKHMTADDQASAAKEMMAVFTEFGGLKDRDPADSQVQDLVKKLQAYITAHFYRCTDEILASLGTMYGSAGEFKTNIDAAGGAGTADFVSEAIRIRCR